jgi:hypothetical protein
VLGLDHCQAGGRLADHFELGPGLRAAIEHHHEPDGAEPEHVPLVEIVHAADTIAAMIGGDDAADALSYPTDRDVMQRLGLDAAGLAGILCATLEEYEELGPLLAG